MNYANFKRYQIPLENRELFERCSIKDLKGKEIKSIEGLEEGSDQVEIVTTDGYLYIMYHEQDCCEIVWIEDVYGEVNGLIGSPVVEAEERTNRDKYDAYGSHTWTFYTLATSKGWLDMRWLGESNGYYSEGVDIVRIKISN